MIVFQLFERKSDPRDTIQSVKKKLNSLQEVLSQLYSSFPIIAVPLRVPKCPEGGMRQDFRNYLQFWVPPILRASGDSSTTDIQNSCKFTDSQFGCSSHVSLHSSENLLDLFWHSNAKPRP